MADVRGFDWDAANVGHILRHGVTPFEVEEAVSRPNVTVPAKPLAAKSAGSYLARRLPTGTWS